MAVKLKPN